jgi:GNAT superfamily N-acetyltransferase
VELIVRPAVEADLDAVEDMVRIFVKGHPAENQPRSRETLRDAFFGETALARLLVACRGDAIVGMGQWRMEYDMFWGIHGGIPEWLFVRPGNRGSGIAAAIMATVCAEVREAGGKFLHAGSGEPRVSRAYEKVATGDDGRTHYVSADGFHAFADLAGRPLREIVRNLPNAALNHRNEDPRSKT